VLSHEHSFTHMHAVLYARARGGSDEKSRLLVGIHLVVVRVVVLVVVVVAVVVVGAEVVP
jgi:hypothetical protein